MMAIRIPGLPIIPAAPGTTRERTIIEQIKTKERPFVAYQPEIALGKGSARRQAVHQLRNASQLNRQVQKVIDRQICDRYSVVVRRKTPGIGLEIHRLENLYCYYAVLSRRQAVREFHASSAGMIAQHREVPSACEFAAYLGPTFLRLLSGPELRLRRCSGTRIFLTLLFNKETGPSVND